MSNETWQLVNGFECLLPYIILDIKDFFLVYFVSKLFYQIYFTLKSIFNKMTAIFYLLLFSFVSRSLTNLTFKTIHQLSCFVGHPVCILYIASQQLSRYMVNCCKSDFQSVKILFGLDLYTLGHKWLILVWGSRFVSSRISRFYNIMFIPINWPLKCNLFKKFFIWIFFL